MNAPTTPTRRRTDRRTNPPPVVSLQPIAPDPEPVHESRVDATLTVRTSPHSKGPPVRLELGLVHREVALRFGEPVNITFRLPDYEMTDAEVGALDVRVVVRLDRADALLEAMSDCLQEFRRVGFDSGLQTDSDDDGEPADNDE